MRLTICSRRHAVFGAARDEEGRKARPMLRALVFSCCLLYLGIGVSSYWVAAGTQADWWQLVTYVWVFLWPFVILLTLFYYNPVAFLAAAAAAVAIFRGWTLARRA
jgi:hypothetical protein